MDICQQQQNNQQLEFKLITGCSKPMMFLAMTSNDISSVQQLIEVNRYDIWAEDCIEFNDKQHHSTNSIRDQLAHQLAIVL